MALFKAVVWALIKTLVNKTIMNKAIYVIVNTRQNIQTFTSICCFIDFWTLCSKTSTCTSGNCHKVFCRWLKIVDGAG